MQWILTSGAHEVDLHYCRMEQVQLDDIAHSLAQTNRFNGHARRPYSVAEHSLLVLEIVERLFIGADVHCRLAAALHDAHEAYIGDISTPVKTTLGHEASVLEHRLERIVRSAFALHTAAHEWREQIKAADLIALATEREQLMPPCRTPWACLTHVQPVRWVDLMSPERLAMSWCDWRQAYTDAVQALLHERGELLHPVAEGAAA
jgi:5'-deoxynucleotidase YfbR-like HD superfamily hydrolase